MKNRLILSLLLDDGLLMNSRQFVLNPICNIDTVRTYLNYDSIDELIVLNVARDNKNIPAFARDLEMLTKNCFVPVCAGGGVQSIYDCQVLLENGVDKVVVNSESINDVSFLNKLANEFGSQFLVCSIDVNIDLHGCYSIYSNNGSLRSSYILNDWVSMVEDAGAGEILLRAIHRDGTASGYDLDLIDMVSKKTRLPIIAAGGFGQFLHLSQAIDAGADAVSVGNAFHFIGEGISKARNYLHEKESDRAISMWSFPSFGNSF